MIAQTGDVPSTCSGKAHSRVHHRTHKILRAFRNQIPGKVDFLYVDEVQDLLIIDTKCMYLALPLLQLTDSSQCYGICVLTHAGFFGEVTQRNQSTSAALSELRISRPSHGVKK